jgi:hypothetical protein
VSLRDQGGGSRKEVRFWHLPEPHNGTLMNSLRNLIAQGLVEPGSKQVQEPLHERDAAIKSRSRNGTVTYRLTEAGLAEADKL